MGLKKKLIKLRPAQKSDEPFIYATWLKGLRFGNDWFELIDSTIYYENYKRVIDVLLSRPTTKVTVSCLKEDPDVILGYCVSEPSTVHYIHVKEAWRKLGIANDLLPKDLKVVTHMTNQGKVIFVNKLKDIKFNPFL